ncbi:unnamed protein product [Arctogadus glacialis]
MTYRRCNSNSKSCDKQPALNPEVTWSIVAAEDPHPDGDDWRSEDKEGSPQGWEEVGTDGEHKSQRNDVYVPTFQQILLTAPFKCQFE